MKAFLILLAGALIHLGIGVCLDVSPTIEAEPSLARWNFDNLLQHTNILGFVRV